MLRAGWRGQEDIAQARANLSERLATLADAERTLARQQQLRGTGAVAQHVYDDALAARDEARARVQAAQQALLELQHGYRPQEIAEAVANQHRAAAASAEASAAYRGFDTAGTG